MITEWLLQLAGAVAAALTSLLPEVDWDISEFADTGWSWGVTLGGFNTYTPVTVLFGCIALLLVVWVSMAAWNLIAFIYHQFWGSS